MENNNSTNISKEASRESFWSLLTGENQYTISIPRIQRDYAYGRKTPEVVQIRKALVKELLEALENKSEVDINFVYGNVYKEDDEIAFVPIDGQQRLTTLFLLHWYCASWADALDDTCKTILGRFKYETRFITLEFCNRLVNDVVVDLKNLDANVKLSDVIKEYYWFFSSFELDATITSMLATLDEIHEQVKNMNDRDAADEFFRVLTADDCPISFLFLNIEDVGLTDEIYIKMNARGKALTGFENFKAQLSAYLSEKDDSFSQDFIGKINGEWAHFFWNEEYRPTIQVAGNKKQTEKSIVFDDQVMHLFKFLMLNEYITNVTIDAKPGAVKGDSKYRIRDVLTGLDESTNFQFTNYLFNGSEFRIIKDKNGEDFVTEEANVDIEVFRFIDKLLDVLSKRKKDTGSICFSDDTLYNRRYIDEEAYYKRLIRSVDDKKLSYEEQVLLYAVFCFIVKYAEEDCSFKKTKELNEWIRVIYNLAHNTLYNTIDDYYRSIKRVRELVDSGKAIDILDYLAKLLRRDYRQGSGFGFVDNQAMEECIKAVLMTGSEDWNKRIKDAEHSFMESQITSLFVFTGIRDVYIKEITDFETDESNQTAQALPAADYLLKGVIGDQAYMDAFDDYLEKINLIFDANKIKPELEKESIFRRALLTFGGEDSYMLPPSGATICFLDANGRERSFKRLFRGDYAKGDHKNLLYFKELLDGIKTNQDLVTQLKAIINGATFDDDSKWKQYFVEMPEILQCMDENRNSADPDGKFVFCNPKRFIFKKSADEVLLLEKTRTSSNNREYYSYVLYLKAKKQKLDVGYYTTHSEGTEKYLTFKDKNDKIVQVVYKQVQDEYKFVARYDKDTSLCDGDIDSMLDFIKNTIA